MIYAGNQRYHACVKAGLKQVPVIIETLSIDEQKERTIRDNVELGDWDYELLANDWDEQDLIDWGVNIDFDESNINDGKEIDIDDIEDMMSIKLEYSFEDFQKVQNAIRDTGKTAECIMWEALKLD